MKVIEVQNLHVFAGYFSLPKNLAYQRGRELLDFFALSPKENAKVILVQNNGAKIFGYHLTGPGSCLINMSERDEKVDLVFLNGLQYHFFRRSLRNADRDG